MRPRIPLIPLLLAVCLLTTLGLASAAQSPAGSRPPNTRATRYLDDVRIAPAVS